MQHLSFIVYNIAQFQPLSCRLCNSLCRWLTLGCVCPGFHCPVTSWRISRLTPLSRYCGHQQQTWMYRCLCHRIWWCFGTCPGMVWLVHIVVWVLAFWAACTLVSTVTVSLMHPLRVNLGSSPSPILTSVFVTDFFIAVLTRMRWDLKVVLVCIYLIVKDAKHI